MFEILKYSFFQNALISWIIISIISWILWVFIVMRKETNITHSISNFLFFWIAVSLLLNWDYYLFTIIFAIFWSIFIYFIESSKFITNESTKEIIAQSGMALWIFVIWFIKNISLDINNFLFWSILFVSLQDIYLILWLWIITIILFYIFWKNYLAIIINEDIAKSKWIKVNFYNLIFLVLLSLFIAFSIRIFWVLLIWAFLVIPANIWKLLWKKLSQVFVYAIIFSVFAVIFGLFSSYFLETSAWASIVLVLLIVFFVSLIIKRFLFKK